ncbi:MAG: NADP(H)-dependent aldo-keto reductase [Rickettsiales bacterium]|nr:NADP(H)-dependent aldo-keto reductase [Rickettsiales bacterium]
MEYRQLGHTDLDVSLICLGTMTWGEQNTEEHAHQQMDYAIEHGVNFFDTAELYPVPPKPETQGRTEAYIGSWFANRGRRDDVILATKVVGRGKHFGDADYFRGEEPRLHAKHIKHAVEGSLKRLQTDYIDLYQLHWPERRTNFFGRLGYVHETDDDPIDLLETLEALDELIKDGKIRHVGLSNETPWGTMKCFELSRIYDMPRMVSVQNPYSLLNRSYEVGMAEVSIREQCGLLAYSPLGFGVLSGKYLNGQKPEGARLTLFERFQRYQGEIAESAVAAYVALAQKFGLDPAQMALSYVNSRPFVTSNIIGATTMEQLKDNIESVNITLSDEVLEGIEAIHHYRPNPCP